MNETLRKFARGVRGGIGVLMVAVTALMGGCAGQPPSRPVNGGFATAATAAQPVGTDAGQTMREELAVATGPAMAEGPIPPARPAPPCEARRGADGLWRAAVLRALDAGLGHWLRNVDVDPKLEHGRFRGWIIRTLPAGDACYADLDLQAGDVVTRINGRPVERPEEASLVWDGLRTSPALVIDFVRAGRPRSLRFRIVEQ